jgi:hypothetical protein
MGQVTLRSELNSTADLDRVTVPVLVERVRKGQNLTPRELLAGCMEVAAAAVEPIAPDRFARSQLRELTLSLADELLVAGTTIAQVDLAAFWLIDPAAEDGNTDSAAWHRWVSAGYGMRASGERMLASHGFSSRYQAHIAASKMADAVLAEETELVASLAAQVVNLDHTPVPMLVHPTQQESGCAWALLASCHFREMARVGKMGAGGASILAVPQWFTKSTHLANLPPVTFLPPPVGDRDRARAFLAVWDPASTEPTIADPVAVWLTASTL